LKYTEIIRISRFFVFWPINFGQFLADPSFFLLLIYCTLSATKKLAAGCPLAPPLMRNHLHRHQQHIAWSGSPQHFNT
jgi:hypothetical protein